MSNQNRNFEEIISVLNNSDENRLEELLDNQDYRLNFSEMYGEFLEYAAQNSTYQMVGILLGEEIPDNESLLYAVERRDKIITAMILSTGRYSIETGIEAIKIACENEYKDILNILQSYIIVNIDEFEEICKNYAFV